MVVISDGLQAFVPTGGGSKHFGVKWVRVVTKDLPGSSFEGVHSLGKGGAVGGGCGKVAPEIQAASSKNEERG